MEKRIIACTPLNCESFKKYGQFISSFTKEPDADIEKLKFWNKLGILDNGGDTSVSIVQTYGKNGLYEETFERHIKTGELLIPTVDIYVVVALSDAGAPSKPDLETVKAFCVKVSEAVIFAPGVWHHAPLTLEETANTFVIFDKDTPEKDFFSIELKEAYGTYYEVKL